MTEALNAKTTTEKETLKISSGMFPRFDRILTAALCKPEHLRSAFGVRFQTYIEESENEMQFQFTKR